MPVNKNKYGFTLIEVVISIMVLTLGVGLLMYVFPAAIEYSKRSKDVTVATFLAQTKMEELQGYDTNIPDSQFGEYAVPDNPKFMYKVEKLPLWGGYKEIKVSVSKPQRNRQGQIIATVYAAVSGITEPDIIGDIAYIAFPYPGAHYGNNAHYGFYADAKNRCIWWNLKCCAYGSNYNYSEAYLIFRNCQEASDWTPIKRAMSGAQSNNTEIAYIPDNGVPEKIRVTLNNTIYNNNYINGNPYAINIYVTDSVNNCVWIAQIDIKRGINESWDNVRLPAPQSYRMGYPGWIKFNSNLPGR